MRVRLANSGRGFSVAPGQPLLDAALAAGLNLPHGCRGGNCGACRARVLAGDVHYPNGVPLGVSAAEAAQGYVLLCQARALGDLHLESIELTTPQQATVKRLPCRIARLVALADDILGVHLKLPSAEAFDFEPGQYLDILLPDGCRRSFSIASAPHDGGPLELHVRRVHGGNFSDRLFGGPRGEPSLRCGSLLRMEGPFGSFRYREASAPMLLVAGGTGIAPLLSMVRHVLHQGLKRDMTLFWGMRSANELYADALLRRWAEESVELHYRAVLSQPDGEWRGERGLVHESVLRNVPHLASHEVYAAGPPAMIEAVRCEFARHGADPARLHTDPFHPAVDAAARQPTTADTNS